jgi:HD superfamily phosphohydrolase
MILRDPVHGLVSFDGVRERVIHELLATSELQRLRRVRQLGLASLVFPGAEHTRFSHALGTAHVMGRLLDRITQVQVQLDPAARLDDEAARDAFAAALLHDLGHGPFSHLYEEVFPGAPRHEVWTERLILDPGTDVHRALEGLGRGMSERVARLAHGEHRLAYLGQAVSGTLDVDRCDYLLRDSHMTGVRYGIYDLDWLLRALTLGEVTEKDGSRRTVLAIEGRKGLPPIEGFFLARNFMYQQVYHHKAVRAAEVALRAVLMRVSELLRDGALLEPCPRALWLAARGEPSTLSAYLELDDAGLTSSIAAWQRSSDACLADLAGRFLRRTLPKTLPLPDALPGAQGPEAVTQLWQTCHDVAREVALRHGFRPDLYVWLDAPSDVPYAEAEEPRTAALWVSLRHRPMSRLGDTSFLLRELRNKRTVRPRLVFPAELRDAITAAVDPLLGAATAGPEG